ncbi:asparaginase [cyanobiont of Ornithocercus magnificus]|nr:asparaginase [cyanobiont of Ornithocercus magnificus]
MKCFSSSSSLPRHFKTQPLQVELKRSCNVESRHCVHAVVCDTRGRILMCAGNADHLTFIRSALKPFQALPFISSGTLDQLSCSMSNIAIACSSHSGTALHTREVFQILWNAELDVELLQCPTPVGARSQLEHNCSGKHAAFLATCRHMSWPLDSYLAGDHPLQLHVRGQVGTLLGVSPDELVVARDNCGAPTLLLRLSQMASLYACFKGSGQQTSLKQISQAMLAYPELVAGSGCFDTELMNQCSNQVLSKGGAEGIQCLSHISKGLGIAIKVEDGSRRAKHAAAIHLLSQLGWVETTKLSQLGKRFLAIAPEVQLEVSGSLCPRES